MKKFFVVTIILFFMSNFSTVQANSISNDDTNNTSKPSHTTMRNYFDELEKWIPENERPKKHDVAQAEKLQQKSEKKFDYFILPLILSVGFITAFTAYQYNKSRQFIKENSFRLWFSNFVNQKNVWILTFCVISFVSCIFYVPYNLVRLDNPNFIYKTAHGTIFEIPKDFRPQNTRIDYQVMAFREFLILMSCCAGYTASTMINKK